MKQHFMTHKLRGDPGYEDAEDSHSASTPDSVCSSMIDSPKIVTNEGLNSTDEKRFTEQKPHLDEAQDFLKTYKPRSPESQMSISPNGNFYTFNIILTFA